MVPPLGAPNRLKYCQGLLWTVVTHVNGACAEKLYGIFWKFFILIFVGHGLQFDNIGLIIS